MNESTIVAEIEYTVDNSGVNYSAWTIGVTDNPSERKTQHGNPAAWFQWNPDGEKDARRIVDHFLDKGMKGGTGGLGDANYVYIF